MKVLAISSGGGHWVELLRVRPAFEGHEVTYATVSPAYRPQVQGSRFFCVPDATRWSKIGAVHSALRVLAVLLRVRPDVVVTTGALPGYLALRMGRWFGARTVWLDSIANAQELSMSGQRAGRYADLWLTQWPELSRPDGPTYAGSVL